MSAVWLNLSTLAGLLLIFAGSWIVFGIGIALLVLGSLLWLTTIYAAQLARAWRAPKASS